jgi:hypothetical protein
LQDLAAPWQLFEEKKLNLIKNGFFILNVELKKRSKKLFF